MWPEKDEPPLLVTGAEEKKNIIEKPVKDKKSPLWKNFP